MIITFLGTSCMVPTKERNHSSMLLEYGAEGILIDCGEGTQRQMKIAGISPTKVKKVLITHWHGDHVLGLPGLIQTLGASEYSSTLEIYGPKGTNQHVKKMFEAFVFDNRIELLVKDIEGGVFLDNKKYKLTAMPLEHTIPCLGYRFEEKDKRRIKTAFTKKKGIPEGPLLGKLQNGQDVFFNNEKISVKDATYIQKGKIIAIVADTVATKNCYVLAKDADYLICESAFTSKLRKKAEEYKHMTAKDASQVANQANAKNLVLFHYSQRYKDTDEIERDARDTFDKIICAQDFTKLRIT